MGGRALGLRSLIPPRPFFLLLSYKYPAACLLSSLIVAQQITIAYLVLVSFTQLGSTQSRSGTYLETLLQLANRPPSKRSTWSRQHQRRRGRGRKEEIHPSMESKMERVSSPVQSWVEEHKLATIGGVWAAAVGASVAYSRRKAPQRATGIRLIHARIHAQALTLAALGGAALWHYYGDGGNKKRRSRDDDLDYDFYAQLPPATDADGNENQRWSW